MRPQSAVINIKSKDFAKPLKGILKPAKSPIDHLSSYKDIMAAYSPKNDQAFKQRILSYAANSFKDLH